MRTDSLPMPKLKALAETYSADTLTENRIRGALELRGTLFVCTSSCYGARGYSKVNADEMIPLEAWPGEIVDYQAIGYRVDDARRQNGTFYEGLAVSYRGRKYVLSGHRTTFQPESGTTITATKQLTLF